MMFKTKELAVKQAAELRGAHTPPRIDGAGNYFLGSRDLENLSVEESSFLWLTLTPSIHGPAESRTVLWC